jgi:hypothetical protein
VYQSLLYATQLFGVNVVQLSPVWYQSFSLYLQLVFDGVVLYVGVEHGGSHSVFVSFHV